MVTRVIKDLYKGRKFIHPKQNKTIIYLIILLYLLFKLSVLC
jgi:hypothetical protein